MIFCVLSIVRYFLISLKWVFFPLSYTVICSGRMHIFSPFGPGRMSSNDPRRGAAKQLPAGGGGIVRVWLCGCNCSKTFHSRRSQTTTLDFLHSRYNDVAKVCSMSVCCQLISAYFKESPLIPAASTYPVFRNPLVTFVMCPCSIPGHHSARARGVRAVQC